MGIYYSVTAGYGIVIDADNVEQIGKALNLEDAWPDEILNELFTELKLHTELTYGSEFDQMSGQGTPGSWIARRDHIISGEPRSDFEPGIQMLPGNVGDGPWFTTVRDWLHLREIEFKMGFFFGLSIS